MKKTIDLRVQKKGLALQQLQRRVDQIEENPTKVLALVLDNIAILDLRINALFDDTPDPVTGAMQARITRLHSVRQAVNDLNDKLSAIQGKIDAGQVVDESDDAEWSNLPVA